MRNSLSFNQEETRATIDNTNLYSESAEADVIGVVDKTSGDGIFRAGTGFELGMS